MPQKFPLPQQLSPSKTALSLNSHLPQQDPSSNSPPLPPLLIKTLGRLRHISCKVAGADCTRGPVDSHGPCIPDTRIPDKVSEICDAYIRDIVSIARIRDMWCPHPWCVMPVSVMCDARIRDEWCHYSWWVMPLTVICDDRIRGVWGLYPWCVMSVFVMCDNRIRDVWCPYPRYVMPVSVICHARIRDVRWSYPWVP